MSGGRARVSPGASCAGDADKWETAGRKAKKITRGLRACWSVNDPGTRALTKEMRALQEQLNYCLMGKRNMLSRLSAAMLPGLGQRGELGAALAPEGRVANQHPWDPRSRQVPPRGDQSLASNWYWQPQFGPNLAQSLSPSKRLTLPRLFYHPGCRQPAPALLHAPDTLPGQHGPPLRRCPRQERGD